MSCSGTLSIFGGLNPPATNHKMVKGFVSSKSSNGYLRVIISHREIPKEKMSHL